MKKQNETGRIHFPSGQITNDAELLRSKGNKSPNLAKMRFRFYDRASKTTHFFDSEDKFEKFMKRQIV